MYTGKHIELDDLFDNNLYDIDHIYPRHFVKDDNIDNNLVLVCKEKNAHKSDHYPIEEEIFLSQKKCGWSLENLDLLQKKNIIVLWEEIHLVMNKKRDLLQDSW